MLRYSENFFRRAESPFGFALVMVFVQAFLSSCFFSIAWIRDSVIQGLLVGVRLVTLGFVSLQLLFKASSNNSVNSLKFDEGSNLQDFSCSSLRKPKMFLLLYSNNLMLLTFSVLLGALTSRKLNMGRW